MKFVLPQSRRDSRAEKIITQKLDELAVAIARYGLDSPMWSSTLQLLIEVRPDLPSHYPQFFKRSTR